MAEDQTLVPDVDFILEHQFKELAVGKPVGLGFLETQFEALKQPREAQLLGVSFDGLVHKWVGLVES